MTREGGETDARRWTRWRVSGRVQGVGFRWFVQQAAARRGLAGDVCNLPDGRVEIRVRGSDEQLRALLADVRRGPGHARVDGVEVLDAQPVEGAVGFEVRFPGGRS